MRIGVLVIAACTVGGLHCPSPDANVLAISKQLKEEEERQKEIDKINEAFIFEAYKEARVIATSHDKARKQPYKPHHKRGGSKYM